MLMIPFNPISTALWAENYWVLNDIYQLGVNINSLSVHYITLITPSWSSWKLLLWATNWPLLPVPYLENIFHSKDNSLLYTTAHLQCSMGLQASWIIGGLTFQRTITEVWDKDTNKTPVIVTVLISDMANCSLESAAWRLGDESVTTWGAIGHTVISAWNLEMLKLSRRQSGPSGQIFLDIWVAGTLGMILWGQ